MKPKFLALASSLLLTSSFACAGTINFETDAIGIQANGFTSAGDAHVHFTDTLGTDLYVGSFGYQGLGQRSLAVLSDDASQLRISFDNPASALSLTFGNDDACCSVQGDRAWLQLLNGTTVVNTVSVVMNRDDIANQVISASAPAFDSALFWYGSATGTPTRLTEVVDDINYTNADVADVPEPTSIALIGLGLASFVAARRKSKKA